MKANNLSVLVFSLVSASAQLQEHHPQPSHEEHLRHPDHHRNAQAATVVTSNTHYGFETNANSARDSCSTLQNCFDCVAAGCSWTQSLLHGNEESGAAGGTATASATLSNSATLARENSGNAAATATAPFSEATATLNKLAVSQCTVLCDGVSADASCFRLGNYRGLNTDEVCRIAERLDVTTVTNEEEIEEENSNAEVPQQAQESATQQEAMEATIEVPIETVVVTNVQVSTTTTQPTQGPTRMPTLAEGNPTEPPTGVSVGDDVVVSSSEMDGERETTMPTPISCAGFISCQKCMNNNYTQQLACVFVASDSCRVVCPELAHVPCYEANGNFTTMTQEDVCAAAASKENMEEDFGANVGFGDGNLPQISTSALRSAVAMKVGGGEVGAFFGNLAIGVTVIVLSFC